MTVSRPRFSMPLAKYWNRGAIVSSSAQSGKRCVSRRRSFFLILSRPRPTIDQNVGVGFEQFEIGEVAQIRQNAGIDRESALAGFVAPRMDKRLAFFIG